VEFAEEVKVEGRHAIVVSDARKEVHEDELAVALAAVARL
jgi:hypothetical protein